MYTRSLAIITHSIVGSLYLSDSPPFDKKTDTHLSELMPDTASSSYCLSVSFFILWATSWLFSSLSICEELLPALTLSWSSFKAFSSTLSWFAAICTIYPRYILFIQLTLNSIILEIHSVIDSLSFLAAAEL